MAIVLRTIKGLPLTYAELDNNFSELEQRITEISNSNVASVNGLSGNVYITTSDITEGDNLYYTDTRVDARISSKSSDFFPEGTINLYYSNARVDARLAAKTTDNLGEGDTNKYYTDARARAAVSSAGGALAYNSSTGVFSISSLTTSTVSEGSNLYFTNARVDARLATSSINVLDDVDTNSSPPVDNYVLTWNTLFSKWIPAPVNFVGAGLGETNTASNVGTGQGLYATKVGYDLRFYTLAGANSVSVSAPSSNVITISTAQDLATSASVVFANANITSTLTTSNINLAAGDLTIATPGGNVITKADYAIFGSGTANGTLTSNGNYDLKLNTNGGTNSGEVKIIAGANGNINLTPNGTGQVVSSGVVNATRFVSNIATGTAPFTVSSTTQVANLNVATAGTAGTVTSAAQPNITSVGNLTTLNVGTVTSATTNGNVSLTPNGTGEVVMSTAAVSDLTATRVVYAGTNGTLVDSANLTFSGTQLTVTGAVNASVFNGPTAKISNLSITTNAIAAVNTNGNINLNPLGSGKVIVGGGFNANSVTSTGITVLGTTSADTLTINGSLITSIIPQSSNSIDIGSVTYKFRNGYFTSALSTEAAVTGSTIVSTTTTGTAPLTVTSTTQVANLNVATAGSLINGNSNVNIAANANVTISSAGTANVVSVSSTGVVVTGTVNSSGNITAPVIVSNVANGTAPFTVTSTTQVANLSAATAGTVTTAAQPNITSVGNLTTLNVANITSGAANGNVTITPNGTGNIVVTSAVLPNANATLSLGATALRFLNIWGVSSSALYADLAERYESDLVYGPGDVLVFGGSKEVTTTDQRADVRVAGVVSTAPAYLMNDENQSNDTHPPIALRGKVPVNVVGVVNKGDLLVTSTIPGYAISSGKVDMGAAVFAKAIENKSSSDMGVVWAVII